MTLRTQFFIAMLVVAICVAGTIVAFSNLGSDRALHRVDSHATFAPNPPPTSAMTAAAVAVEKNIRLSGTPASASLRRSVDWNMVLVSEAGKVLASTDPAFSGTSLRKDGHAYSFYASLGETGHRGSIAMHLVPVIHLNRKDQTPVADLLFVPTEKAVRDLTVAETLRALEQLLLAASLAALVASVFVSASLAAYLVKPLMSFRKAAASMAAGDLSMRVPLHDVREIGEVAKSFNAMAQRLEQMEQYRKNLMNDIAHELRTPLTYLHGQLEAMEAGLIEPSLSRIGSLREETANLAHLVGDLQQIALVESSDLCLDVEPVALFEFLNALSLKITGLAATKRIVVSIDCEPSNLMIAADVPALRQVVLNVVANAIRHAPEGGRVALAAKHAENAVLFTVTDNGPSVPQAHLQDIFERFFRTDGGSSREAGGTGLGLAIVKNLVEAHGGAIYAENVENGGAKIAFTIPVYAD